MPLDFSVRRPSRRCAATDRPFEPGEAFVSVLIDEAAEVVRRDFALTAWGEPPEGAIAWWRSQTPSKGRGVGEAPREVMLRLLDEWADRPDEASARYVLALLLVRRKVLRLEADGLLEGLRKGESTEATTEPLRLVHAGSAATIEVPVAPPTPENAPHVEARLAELLGAA